MPRQNAHDRGRLPETRGSPKFKESFVQPVSVGLTRESSVVLLPCPTLFWRVSPFRID